MCNVYSTALHMSTQPRNTKKSKDFRSRLWAFTLNNYTDEEVKELLSVSNCEYVFQEEKGEETGTLHLQGFLKFKDGKTMSAVKKINERMHLEVGKNEFALKNYCTKAATRNGKIWTNMEIAQPALVQKTEKIYVDDYKKMIVDRVDRALRDEWERYKASWDEDKSPVDLSQAWTLVDPDNLDEAIDSENEVVFV